MDELSQEKRIFSEFQKISCFFDDLSEGQKSVVLPLCQNAAFMKVTLSDLQKIIAQQGCVEFYQNGTNQKGFKQSAALQSYNSLMKNFVTVTKRLFELLPPEKRPVSIFEWEPKEKTEEEIKGEREAYEEQQARIKIECERANAFLSWQREQEEKGIKSNIGFSQWKELNYGEEVKDEG